MSKPMFELHGMVNFLDVEAFNREVDIHHLFGESMLFGEIGVRTESRPRLKFIEHSRPFCRELGRESDTGFVTTDLNEADTVSDVGICFLSGQIAMPGF